MTRIQQRWNGNRFKVFILVFNDRVIETVITLNTLPHSQAPMLSTYGALIFHSHQIQLTRNSKRERNLPRTINWAYTYITQLAYIVYICIYFAQGPYEKKYLTFIFDLY